LIVVLILMIKELFKDHKQVVAVIGVILLILGLTISIPAFLNANYVALGAGGVSVIAGVILIAFGFEV